MKKILIGALIALAVIFVGVVVWGTYFFDASQKDTNIPCTEEAKICPNGSTVGRTGPNCEFAPCSTETLPQGYTLATYSVEKVLDISCQKTSDCSLPGEYAIVSRCPLTSLCLQNKCTVVCPGRTTEQFIPPTNWKTFFSTTTNITFRYPEQLGTTYIHPVDWPPQVQVVNQAFSCVEAGTEIMPAGKTEKHIVENQTYCVTKESEGAAGSIYTQYAYAFPYKNQTVILTFTLRMVQCANYDDPQKTACENERASFNTDTVLDQIIRTIQ
jgi:hypothetical protein